MFLLRVRLWGFHHGRGCGGFGAGFPPSIRARSGGLGTGEKLQFLTRERMLPAAPRPANHLGASPWFHLASYRRIIDGLVASGNSRITPGERPQNGRDASTFEGESPSAAVCRAGNLRDLAPEDLLVRGLRRSKQALDLRLSSGSPNGVRTRVSTLRVFSGLISLLATMIEFGL